LIACCVKYCYGLSVVNSETMLETEELISDHSVFNSTYVEFEYKELSKYLRSTEFEYCLLVVIILVLMYINILKKQIAQQYYVRNKLVDILTKLPMPKKIRNYIQSYKKELVVTIRFKVAYTILILALLSYILLKFFSSKYILLVIAEFLHVVKMKNILITHVFGLMVIYLISILLLMNLKVPELSFYERVIKKIKPKYTYYQISVGGQLLGWFYIVFYYRTELKDMLDMFIKSYFGTYRIRVIYPNHILLLRYTAFVLFLLALGVFLWHLSKYVHRCFMKVYNKWLLNKHWVLFAQILLFLVAIMMSSMIYYIIKGLSELTDLMDWSEVRKDINSVVELTILNLIQPIVACIGMFMVAFEFKLAGVVMTINMILSLLTIRNKDMLNELASKYDFLINLQQASKYTKYMIGISDIIKTKKYVALKFFKLLSYIPGIKCAQIYKVSACSFNNVYEMYRFLSDFKTLMKLVKKGHDVTKIDNVVLKHYGKVPDKYQVTNIPKEHQFYCSFNEHNDREPITNIGPQVNGIVVKDNSPFKIHPCCLNQCEAVYRQVQVRITYSERKMNNFLKFAKREIDRIVEAYYSKYDDYISLEKYFSKLGSKRKEYVDGYDLYLRGDEVRMEFKMHNKSDEKIVIHWKLPKGKARNISAQKQIAKVIFGLVCEYGMRIIHKEEWCGAGKNYEQKCNNFKEWAKKLGEIGSFICCDGSAFDSTQHQILIKNIDSYFLRRVYEFNRDKILTYFNSADVLKVIDQSEFTIYAKYFTFKIKGTQLSGRMNTCLSNTLRSYLYIRYIIYKIEKSFLRTLYNVVFFFEVLGDDQIIMTLNKWVEIYKSYAYKYVYWHVDEVKKHGLGQICKMFEVVKGYTGAEYLSCTILYNEVSQEFLMIRKIDRFFQLCPYTYRNTFKNIKKFKYMQYQLALIIGENITINNQSIELYKKYGETLLRITSQIHMKNPLRHKSQSAYNRKINNLQEHLKYVNHDRVFKSGMNEIFEEYLYNSFKITKEDINEYYDKLDMCDSLDDDISCNLIDKIYNVSEKEYNTNYKLVHSRGFNCVNIETGEEYYRFITKF